MLPIEALTEINLDDLVSSFGWQDQPLPASLLRRLFWFPAKKFAHLMLEFDNDCGVKSLQVGSLRTVKRFARRIQVFGMENVPANGPVLFLSNHPGMIDTLSLFASINRSDLRVIALNRPFLASLPKVVEHLFFISDDSKERIRVVRQTTAHLRAGGAVLTFPAGKIEPDPQTYPGADLSLQDWTESAGVFARLAPETQIIPTLVSGVLWEKMVKLPLIRFKKKREEQEKLGAAFQLLAHILFNLQPLSVKIQFAKPFTISEINSNDLVVIHSNIMERMHALLKNEQPSEGVLIYQHN